MGGAFPDVLENTSIFRLGAWLMVDCLQPERGRDEYRSLRIAMMDAYL
jgi:hypothetical protein